MSLATTKVDRYTSTEPLPTTTGGMGQQQLARMIARMVARYKLEAVPGRPEELREPGTDRGVSIGFGCKTIRVRGMIGRNWADEFTQDFQIAEGWTKGLHALLDPWFSYQPRGLGDAGLLSVNTEHN